MKGTGALLLAVLILLCGPAVGEDAYYDVPLGGLTITEGEVPVGSGYDPDAANRVPDVRLAGPGEAYVRYLDGAQWAAWRSYRRDNTRLSIAAPAGQDVRGYVSLPRDDGDGMVRLAFQVPATSATDAAGALFHLVRQQHYEALLDRGIPGAAWFRYRARQAREARGDAPVAEAGGELPEPWRRPDELEDTYALFTGGRAMSENLALDRLLRSAGGGEPSVDVASLPGISVQEMDWKPLVKDLDPEKDPLAALVPADQHALFFPSFNAFMDMLDEARANGTPVLRLLDVRSEDARTHERYERQLCLSADALARILGPQTISSVAVTGSDPYMRTGTDVAVLYEAKNPAVLRTMIDGRVAAAARAKPDAETVRGEVGGVPYSGARSPDRAVCSYVATVGTTVVVTNSLHQLGRIVSVAGDEAASMAALDEYTFFRERYRRGEEGETALLVMPDAAIRRWCGPRWRIGASRRTRAAAFMADLQARHVDELAAGGVQPAPLDAKMPLPDGGELRLGPEGVSSSVYGNLEFLTPISEIPLDMATEAEAAAYRTWLASYQRNWRMVFDPIAVRFSVAPEGLSADVTVMPLIEGSDYREMIALGGSAKIAPDAGDPHEGTLLHFAMAIDASSGPAQETSSLLTMMTGGLGGASPLAWLGESVAIYADDAPFWDALVENADDVDTFMEANVHKMPVALHAEAKDALRLAAFLTALRGFVEATAPGLTQWETLAHNDQPYVKISPTVEAKADMGAAENLAVFYAASPGALLVTLDEAVLKCALDRGHERRKARAEDRQLARAGKPWLGSSMCLQVGSGLLDAVRALTEEPYQQTMRRRSFGNIPILNEWKRLCPDRDPVQVHQQLWQTRLVCPGGGAYEWNEDWQTMASTVYGHPGEPKDGPSWPQAVLGIVFGNLGVTFENQGLRARAVIERGAQNR